MRYIPKDEKDYLSIDDIISKSTKSTRTFSPVYDSGGQPLSGMVDGLPAEKPIDFKLLDNEGEILSILMKAGNGNTGTGSQHVVPSFYEGGDDVYIENKKVADVTVTEGDRRAIHTISNYYNTLGIYRDDFDKNNNDKLARNAYYAICEKAMMDYMRSVQWTVKDSRTGDTIREATEFFETPNPQDAMGDIMAMVIRDVTRYDAGVIVKTFNKAGFCVEIKPYLATEFWREQDRVPFIVNVPIMNTVDLTGGAYASHQQPTYQGWWSHGYTERFWQRSRTGVYIPFQPEEVAYFMMYPRTDGIYGTDFIKFLKYQIQYLIDSTKAAGKTFENGVVPSVVWEHPEIRTVQQLKQRIAELKYNNQGWQRFGSVIHTVNGEKVASLAQSLHDMQWLEGQKFVAQLVWATWGFSPEEFMGGGENRATAYVKRNITKSRLLYPLMTFLEGRINREILPYLKGYRKFWKFSFTRDIELDDEQKVATTNSIKASTFLQYYGAGFPIEASMELSGLDKNQYKFNIEVLEAEIMQNQMMMLGQPGMEQGGEQTAGLENEEAGRYGPASEVYSDSGVGDTGQGAAQGKSDPREPSIDEEQYKKAGRWDKKPEEDYNQTRRQEVRLKNIDKYDTSHRGEHWGERPFKIPTRSGEAKVTHDTSPLKEKYARHLIRDDIDKAKTEREEIIESNRQAGKNLGEETDQSNKDTFDKIKTVAQLAPLVLAKKKKEANTIKKSVTINPALVGAGLAALGGRALWQHGKKKQKERELEAGKKEKEGKVAAAEAKVKADKKAQQDRWDKEPSVLASPPSPGGKRTGHQTHWEGGVAKALEMGEKDTRPDGDYDSAELSMGIRAEMEHTDNEDIAKEIAKDHLDEFDDYYTHLKKMEEAMRSGKHIEYYTDSQGIRKAKVYITHPSEAPKGRPVRRGNKGGYYYITTEQHKGGAEAGGKKEHAQQKKKSGGKGWESGGGGSEEAGVAPPPPPPEIEGATMQINISGMGIGVAAGLVGGRLVVSKLSNVPTAKFIKICEKKAGEMTSAEGILEIMVITAKEMGLEIMEA